MTSRYKGICTDKSANRRIIVAGLEVIEASFTVVNISTVAQGVNFTQVDIRVIIGRNQPSPSVVDILDHGRARAVYDGDYIALQVRDVIVRGIIVANHQGSAIRTVAKAHHHTATGHLRQLGTVIQVGIGGASVGLLGPHAVGIISKVPGGSGLIHGVQLPTVLPVVCPCAVVHGVADSVISDPFAIISSQKIAPIGITVSIVDGIKDAPKGPGGIGIFLLALNVARAIVGPDPGPIRRLVILPGQLVGTAPGGVVPLRDFLGGYLSKRV